MTLAQPRNHSYNRGVIVARDRTAKMAALPVLGLGSIGRIMRPESSQAWDHAPEYEGYRPMLGMR